MIFESLGWKHNPYLLAQITFKPPIIEQQAKEARTDPDGLDQPKRMQPEAKAIEKTIDLEPNLQKAAEGNKGYDLYEEDAEGNVVRWVDVKSMTGSLNDRPVGLLRAQFDLASERREGFWLCVVEHASETETARVVKFQDPAGCARTFDLIAAGCRSRRPAPRPGLAANAALG